MNPNFKVVLKGSTVGKDGQLPIYLRITLKRKHTYISLKHRVAPNKWDAAQGRVKGNTPKIQAINKKIDQAKTKLTQAINTLEGKGKIVTLDTVRTQFLSSSRAIDFIEYAYEYVQIKTDERRSPEYTRTVKSVIDNLKRRYCQRIDIRKIDQQWLENYRRHLHNHEQLAINTIQNKLKTLRTILLYAKRQGIIQVNPFENIRLETQASRREFLTTEELVKVYTYYADEATPLAHKNCLRYFLFCCYTGLRRGDIMKLTFDDIHGETIRIQMNKTREMVHIPLSIPAKKLLPPYPSRTDLPIFRVRQNPNPMLKVAIQKAGIQKHITFHCARHTFASISLELDLPLKVVSKILGHTHVKTTEIYTRILDKKVEEQMQKWNIFAKFMDENLSSHAKTSEHHGENPRIEYG